MISIICLMAFFMKSASSQTWGTESFTITSTVYPSVNGCYMSTGGSSDGGVPIFQTSGYDDFDSKQGGELSSSSSVFFLNSYDEEGAGIQCVGEDSLENIDDDGTYHPVSFIHEWAYCIMTSTGVHSYDIYTWNIVMKYGCDDGIDSIDSVETSEIESVDTIDNVVSSSTDIVGGTIVGTGSVHNVVSSSAETGIIDSVDTNGDSSTSTESSESSDSNEGTGMKDMIIGILGGVDVLVIAVFIAKKAIPYIKKCMEKNNGLEQEQDQEQNQKQGQKQVVNMNIIMPTIVDGSSAV